MSEGEERGYLTSRLAAQLLENTQPLDPTHSTLVKACGLIKGIGIEVNERKRYGENLVRLLGMDKRLNKARPAPSPCRPAMARAERACSACRRSASTSSRTAWWCALERCRCVRQPPAAAASELAGPTRVCAADEGGQGQAIPLCAVQRRPGVGVGYLVRLQRPGAPPAHARIAPPPVTERVAWSGLQIPLVQTEVLPVEADPTQVPPTSTIRVASPRLTHVRRSRWWTGTASRAWWASSSPPSRTRRPGASRWTRASPSRRTARPGSPVPPPPPAGERA